eukprot:TRINITY_DN7570_c0_g1_i1.p1 TRINITY_DN7570_c0_g1~~TRINITY_DN7570_c0_g1_i1.p1  ORF type:complete len:822 (+),score=150.81 TRINITY_DN7570_c0_g1_i1:29-2467(+)
MTSMRRPKTPTMPRPSSPTPGRGAASNTPWFEVLELCKKGFANKMQFLEDEMAFTVKAAVKEGADVLRNEVEDIMRIWESPMDTRIADLVEQVKRLEERLSSQPTPDLGGVIERLQASEVAYQASGQLVVDKLDAMMQSCGRINESGLGITELLQRLEVQVDRLEAKADTSNEKLEQVCSIQKALKNVAGQIAKDLSLVQQQERRHRTELGGILEDRIGEQLNEVREHVVNIGITEVHADIILSRRQVESESRTLLSEIARIQQALQLDFLDVLSDKVDKAVKGIEGPSSGGDQKQLSFEEAPGISPPPRIRLREIFVQTDKPTVSEKICQTDPRMFENREKEKKKTKLVTRKEQMEQQYADVAGADKLKSKARAAAVKPRYNVVDYYWESGVAQSIAKSSWFENITLAVVMLNAVWLAIDADLNPAPLWINASPTFQVAENGFCIFFVFEIIIRFSAFRRKTDCLLSAAFVFDLMLAVVMVGETWILMIALATTNIEMFRGSGTLSVLKIIRMVKLLKLTRLVRLLRAIPELVIITKGLGLASRSVAVFFGFWLIIVYVFALTFKELSGGPNIGGVGKTYFKTVPMAINTLLLQALFPESAELINDITDEYWYMWPVIFFFFSLVSLTVMYMLVGVLVDVVGVISTVEKESLTVTYVASELRDELEQLGFNLEIPITKYEFEKLIIEPKIVQIIDSVGVDVVILCDMIELIYEDKEKKGHLGLEFPELIDAILSMRGSNPATVKDCKENLRLMKQMICDMSSQLARQVLRELDELKLDIQEIREDVKDLDHGRARRSIVSEYSRVSTYVSS